MTNDAAERLRGVRLVDDDSDVIEFNRLLDEALAAERHQAYREGRLAAWDDIVEWVEENRAIALDAAKVADR